MEEKRKPFEVGDEVTVLTDHLPRLITRVTKVQTFKRRAKITTEKGAEYDQGGLLWSRDVWSIHTARIRHAEPGDADAIRHSLLIQRVYHAMRQVDEKKLRRLALEDLRLLAGLIKKADEAKPNNEEED